MPIKAAFTQLLVCKTNKTLQLLCLETITRNLSGIQRGTIQVSILVSVSFAVIQLHLLFWDKFALFS